MPKICQTIALTLFQRGVLSVPAGVCCAALMCVSVGLETMQRLRGSADLSSRLLSPMWLLPSASYVLHLSDLTLLVIPFLSCVLLSALCAHTLRLPYNDRHRRKQNNVILM